MEDALVSPRARRGVILANMMFATLAPGESLYALLDAARQPEIPMRLKSGAIHHDCLYQGPTADALWFVAPYIARCERTSAFVTWLLEEGWGQNWGVFIAAAVDLASLRQHLRKFLLVKMECADADFYFRFYDPRVLSIFLPTCTGDEAAEFFGPVRCYLSEGRPATYIARYSPTRQGVSRDTAAIPSSFEP
jgi:Domain of unknown function (DUF4123)